MDRALFKMNLRNKNAQKYVDSTLYLIFSEHGTTMNYKTFDALQSVIRFNSYQQFRSLRCKAIPIYFNVYRRPTDPKFLKFAKKSVKTVINACK